jgi:glyoxylase I family protein
MNTVHHIAFRCADRNRQEAFYARHFGFKRARVFERGKPGEFIVLRSGSACIELFPASPADVKKRGAEQAVGFTHLALEVPDIEKAVKKLEADGVKTEGIVDCSGMCPGLKVCFFTDPDGNRIEVMQGWTDEK